MKKILIVDDVKFFREMERTVLLKSRCEVLEASDGREALEIIAAEHPDLILMDLLMPGMDGYECCMAIKSDPSLKHIPVVMVSSANNIDDQGKCYAAGCDDYITKPIHEKLLLEKVRIFLNISVRSQYRVPVNLEVAFQVDGLPHKGRIKNISEDGLFVETPSTLHAGSSMKITFNLPMDPFPLKLQGKVVRVEENIASKPGQTSNGAGIEFQNVPFRNRQCIGEYVNFSLIYPD